MKVPTQKGKRKSFIGVPPAARGAYMKRGDAVMDDHPINGRIRYVHPDARVQEIEAPPQRQRLIEGDSQYRKQFPMAEGLLDYFPDALAAVSEVSFHGNNKHNPGEPLHHARGKSMDHANCIMRHLLERGGFDGDIRHTAALAWRALALLQEELEREMNLPLPRGAQ